MRPVSDIIADRNAARERAEAAEAEFKKFDDELRAVQSVVNAALKPPPVYRGGTQG